MSLAFSRDDKKLMAGFYFGLVKVWNLSGGTNEVTLRGHNRMVLGVVLLPDGRTLVSTSTEIRFWDLVSQRELFPPLQPRSTLFRGGSISPDGRRFAVGAHDGIITIFDLASRQEVVSFQGHEHQARFVAFLSDDKTLVSAGLDQVRVWRAPSLAEIDAHNTPNTEKRR
jgi:WD40 repeat protein